MKTEQPITDIEAMNYLAIIGSVHNLHSLCALQELANTTKDTDLSTNINRCIARLY